MYSEYHTQIEFIIIWFWFQQKFFCCSVPCTRYCIWRSSRGRGSQVQVLTSGCVLLLCAQAERSACIAKQGQMVHKIECVDFISVLVHHEANISWLIVEWVLFWSCLHYNACVIHIDVYQICVFPTTLGQQPLEKNHSSPWVLIHLSYCCNPMLQ